MIQDNLHLENRHISLKENTINALYWNFTANFLKQVLNFVIGIILARLLSPKEFGLVGMVAVFTGFVSIFLGQWFGAVVIQKQDLNENHLNSIFWLNVCLGISCTVILSIASPFVAKFYQLPILQPITVLISLNFFIGSFGIVQTSLLDRRMDFRRFTIIDTISVICAGTIGIMLAIGGFGVWSLVWQALALSLLTVILTWFMSPWRPSLQFHFSAINDVKRFSMNLLGVNVLNFLSRNFDNLLIGRFIGSYALGIYAKAYQSMLLPLTQISWVTARVMFPSLSSIQGDIARAKKVYLSTLRAIALVTFPLMVGMFVVSKSFVLVVFGSKWSEMIPILQVFCLAGIVDSITTTVGWIYQSQGRTDIEFKLGSIQVVIVLIAFIIGLHWGIMGVAVAYVLTAYIISWYPCWTIAGRLINLRFSEMLNNVLSSLYCSVTMGIVIWVIGLMLPSGWTDWKHLIVQVLCGVGFYWGIIHIFRLKAYIEIREIVFKSFCRRGIL